MNFFKNILDSIFKKNRNNRDIDKINFTNDCKTLYCFYDLDLHPISFDVMYFVVSCEIIKKELDLEKIHICIVPMINSEARPVPKDYDAIIDIDSRIWRLENIVLQAPLLMPSVVGISFFGSKNEALQFRNNCKYSYPNKFIKELNRMPHHVDYFNLILGKLPYYFIENKDWGLKASKQALRYVNQWLKHNTDNRLPVVITLRQYQVDAARNSSEDDWCMFADYLLKKNFLPIFIPDTDHAFEISLTKFSKYLIFEPACWSLQLRMAIYETAYLNMFVNTGPNSLAVLSKNCRYIFLKIIVENVELTTPKFLEWLGFKIGEQPPFCNEYQKWAWNSDDSFQSLKNEFNAMERKINQIKGHENGY